MSEPTQPPNTIELQGTPEELGKEIYRLLCGKKKEASVNGGVKKFMQLVQTRG